MIADDADASVYKELSIEKACEEFNKSVKLSLTYINQQLDDTLVKNCNGLDELSVKIAARTNFLEKNPSFLSCLLYSKDCIKCDDLLEFNEIKATLKEHCKSILQKIDDIETYHKRLLELVMKSGQDQEVVDQVIKARTESDDHFQDCLDKINPKDEFQMTNSDIFSIDAKKKVTSFDRVTIQADAFSAVSPHESLNRFNFFNKGLAPEVERRRPQEDIHGKMLQQVVATDSLAGFMKLMDRKPQKKLKNNKMKKENELEEKYTGSLWFFHSRGMKKTSKTNEAKKISQKISKLPTVSSGSGCCSLLVTSSQPCPLTNQEKTRKVNLKLESKKLKCYDLLDDVDYNDLQPLRSEYPRRDENTSPKKETKSYLSTHPEKEPKSYLHRMLDENDKVWKKLIQPIEPKVQLQQSPKLQPKEQKEVKKKKPQQLSPTKAKQVKNLMEYLTSPQQKVLNHIPRTTIVMPVKVIYDNFPTKDITSTKNVLITDLTKCPDGKAKVVENPKPPVPVAENPEKKQDVVNQLKGFTKKNENIQKNIQKAITVIETKMVNLLSLPPENANKEAFNAMEKEITNVLTMMNDEEKREKLKSIKSKSYVIDDVKIEVTKPKIEDKPPEPKKLVAEKDGSVKSASPRTNSSRSQKSKNAPPEIRFDTGDVPQVKKKEKLDGTEKRIEKITKRISLDRNKEEGLKKKEDATTKDDQMKAKKIDPSGDKAPKTKKIVHEEAKKTANIEEGERLLGQVDNVIRKIDSIYTKFCDEGKVKIALKPQGQFSVGSTTNKMNSPNSVINKTTFPEFMDIFEVFKVRKFSNTLLEYKFYEQNVSYFVQPTVFCQTKIYYRSRMKRRIAAKKTKESSTETIKVVEIPKKIMEIEKIKKENSVISFKEMDDRHSVTLTAIYSAMFSTILMVLNFDFAA